LFQGPKSILKLSVSYEYNLGRSFIDSIYQKY